MSCVNTRKSLKKYHYFINLFLSARSEIFLFYRPGKILVGFVLVFLQHIFHQQTTNTTTKILQKFLYSHFGIITIYCSWMIFNFFIWTNKHKNMFMLYVAKKRTHTERKERKKEELNEWMKSEIPRSSCKMKFHCCPFIIGGLTVMFFCCWKNYDFVFFNLNI